MYSETDEFGTPYDQASFPNVIPEKKSDHFGPDLGVKDISEMPPARPGQGAKL